MTRSRTICASVDCPERTGGKCWAELGEINREVVRELRVIRQLYDRLESDHLIDKMETPEREYVTWRGWKMIRNPISDRIEEITGSRI